MTALGEWGDAVDTIKAGGTIDALDSKAHPQGMSRDEVDYHDGARDAQRVLAGKNPHRPLNETTTPAYRQGWEETASMALEVIA